VRATDIPGWMEGGALTFLAAEAKKHRVIVEIGVWKGKSSACLAANTPGIVYAVDHFRGNPKAHKTVHKQAVDDRDGLIAECRANLHEYIVAKKLQLVIMDSARAALGLRNLGIVPDMVFIDGDHDTPAVKADIITWKGMIKPGGLLCGHDSIWDSVLAAINELLPGWKQVERCCVWKYDC